MNETYETVKTVVGMVKSRERAEKVAELINGSDLDEGLKVTTLDAGSSWAVVLESDYDLEDGTEDEFRGMVKGIMIAMKS